jgi:predicted Fe-Mo cluster-binding NifX family protein
MKLAVSSSGTDLDSSIDPRFGRCSHFVIVETDDMSYDAFENENAALGGGAGIQSAQFVVSKGAGAVLTGRCGPKAEQALSAAAVELFTDQTGTVRDSIERYKKGKLAGMSHGEGTPEQDPGPTTPRKGGPPQAAGPGKGTGRGKGGGMGKGRRQGGGRGMGSGRSSSSCPNRGAR